MTTSRTRWAPDSLKVTDTQFSRPGPGDHATGIRAYASCLLNGRLRVTGLTVRVTRNGRWTVSWPAKDTPGGRRLVVWPVTSEARLEIESAILAVLPSWAGFVGPSPDSTVTGTALRLRQSPGTALRSSETEGPSL